MDVYSINLTEDKIPFYNDLINSKDRILFFYSDSFIEDEEAEDLERKLKNKSSKNIMGIKKILYKQLMPKYQILQN